MNNSNPSILIVDDDVDTCLNLADIFTALGYRVDMAHEGLAALEHVRNNPYDAVLLDLTMPGMDGLTLYRQIKKVQAGTVGIMISGFATIAIANEAVAAGVEHVLPKPVDVPELLGLMNQALDRPLALVIDDDQEFCESLWDVLRDRGYRVCLAHDESTAAARLKDREYDVVLIDMKLPQSDGQRVFRLVRKMNSQARTIAITGFRSETAQLVREVVAEGVGAVCYKPFDIPELLSTVEQLAGQCPG